MSRLVLALAGFSVRLLAWAEQHHGNVARSLGLILVVRWPLLKHDWPHAGLVGSGECERLLQLIEPDIDVTGFQ